jgi:outer membrane biosynthesis protein TonB
MKKIITFLFLILFTLTYGQTSKENKKKNKSAKTETPISVNKKAQDSIMRSRGGIQSEDGQTWSVPDESISQIVPEKEDIKIYERKEVEVPAEFKGGDAKMNQFIAENFVVPAKITEKKITGEIVLSFVVEKDGTLTNIKTIKDLGYKTDKELARVANSTKWYPAELNGKKVRTVYKMTYLVNGSN